jgi:predicted esterase
MNIEKNTASSSFKIAYDYWIRKANQPKELILLLHGFSQRGESIFKKLVNELPAHAIVLSPNAPFPSPVRINDEYKEAYAWYFYLSKEKRFVIPPTEATKSLKDLICDLGYEKLPIRIIGFSQGGYMAPWLVKELPNVHHSISISADYPAHYYEGLRDYKFDIIHGVEDKIAPIASIRNNTEILKTKNRNFTLHELDNTGHEINAAVVELVQKLLDP